MIGSHVEGSQRYRSGMVDDEDGDILFETAFENKRSKAVRVQEYGRPFLSIEPGETRHVESRSPLTSFARFSRIVFHGRDKVSFTENKAWKWPFPDHLQLEVLNSVGPTNESIRIGNKFYPAQVGLPILVPVEPDDLQWCFVEKLERKMVEKKIKENDYFRRVTVPEWTKTLRSKKEITKIENQLLAARTERTEKEREDYVTKVRSYQ